MNEIKGLVWSLVLLTALLLAPGCGGGGGGSSSGGGGNTDDGGGGNDDDDSVEGASADVGADGGTLTFESPDNPAITVSLDIPAFALSANATLSVEPAVNPPSAGGNLIVGTAFTFEPEGTVFLVPATLTLTYDSSALDGTPEGELYLHKAVDDAWSVQDSAPDLGSDSVSGQITGFSTWGIAGILAPANVVYVDAAAVGNEDGTSWSDAFTVIQDAVASVEAEELSDAQIWVAVGIYRASEPDAPVVSLDQDIASLALLGGFAGTEIHPVQRPSSGAETLLDGDVNEDDAGGAPGADNSRHLILITGAADVTIGRFTLQAGNADGANSRDNSLFLTPVLDGRGAGIVVTYAGNELDTFYYSQVSLDEVSIVDNKSADTAAVYVECADVTFTDSTVARNTFTGLFVASASCPGGAPATQLTAQDLRIYGNTGAARGGGLFAEAAALDAQDLLIFANTSTSTTAGHGGGGLFLATTADVSLRNVAIVRNSAVKNGGGIHASAGAPSLRNATIVDNRCNGGSCYGAGVWVQSTAALSLSHGTVARNVMSGGASMHGAGIRLTGGSATLTNVTVTANQNQGTSGDGAGLDVVSAALTLRHASVHDNVEPGAFATEMQVSNLSTLNMVNSLIYGAGDETAIDGGATVSATYSCARVASELGSGTGIVAAGTDPIDDASASWESFQVTDSNDCQGGGDESAADLYLPNWAEMSTTADFAPDSGTVDMGRHYDPNAPVVTSFTDSDNSLSWETSGATSCLLAHTANDGTDPVVEDATLSATSLTAGIVSTRLYYLICQGNPDLDGYNQHVTAGPK